MRRDGRGSAPRPSGGLRVPGIRLLEPEALVGEIASRPPVLLVHGDADPVVPFESMGLAETALKSVGVETLTHVSRGIGHGIAPDGLTLALRFIRSRFGLD